MIQTFSFLSNEVSLVYAMAFTRSKKTKRVIKTPEIEFLIRNKPVLVLDHKVMWQILDLMDIKSKFSYGNYMRMMDEEPENPGRKKTIEPTKTYVCKKGNTVS